MRSDLHLTVLHFTSGEVLVIIKMMKLVLKG